MSKSINVTVTERNGRKYASTGSAWEPVIGYSRAVRTGDTISVTGTVGIEPDGTFATTLKAQTSRALAIIKAAIEALGGEMSDVIRTRIYVTDISRWKEVGEAHGEVFAEIRPATTMVEITRLIDDAALVEVEADAIVLRG
ncbi:RidA family protein [Singulisphaera sp. PoT]|uniref:RidA family protein n=1 Tax=Singulisphaera sp. PoT TaxID=3411797 RepID=UPI003BF4BB34